MASNNNPSQEPYLSQYSPIHENQDHQSESSNGFGCFRLFGIKRKRSSRDNQVHKYLLHNEENCNTSDMTWWLKSKLLIDKVKNFSQVLKGKNWKNFIRKIGGYCRRKNHNPRFQYDPKSYALNFDNGAVDRQEDVLVRDFSVSRYSDSFGSTNQRTGL